MFLEDIYNDNPINLDNYPKWYFLWLISNLDNDYITYIDWEVKWYWYFNLSEVNTIDVISRIKKTTKDDKKVYLEVIDGKYYVFLEVAYKDWFIYFGKDITEVSSFQSLLLNLALVVAIIIIVEIYFISLWASKKILKPISETNNLLREFNHNVSHELKTPISIVKSNLELMEYVDDKKELMESSLEELDIMENIVTSILLLSKNQKPTRFETIDIIDMFDKFAPMMEQKYQNYLTYEVDVCSNRNVRANPQLINILTRNIVENLYKYAIKDSHVTFSIDLEMIVIKNKYDAKTEIDNRLLAPFIQWKNKSDDGFGIWLAIIKRICDLHNFEYSISSKWDTCIQKIKIR